MRHIILEQGPLLQVREGDEGPHRRGHDLKPYRSATQVRGDEGPPRLGGLNALEQYYSGCHVVSPASSCVQV